MKTKNEIALWITLGLVSIWLVLCIMFEIADAHDKQLILQPDNEQTKSMMSPDHYISQNMDTLEFTIHIMNQTATISQNKFWRYMQDIIDIEKLDRIPLRQQK